MPCDVSIILCTSNRADSLRDTLAHMSSVLAPGRLTAEVIVVDNASKDKTRDVVLNARRFHIPVRYVLETRSGKSIALNTAVAASKAGCLLFTDDDVRPQATWVDDMCLPIADGHADVVAGAVICPSHLWRPWMDSGLGWCFALTPTPQTEGETYVVGANMAFARRVFAKVPGFDPELGPGALGFGEETLFCRQVREAGFRIISNPEAVVEHHFEASRLSRSSLISDATKRGRAAAYTHHHWQHTLPRFPALRLPLSLARLAWLRLLHPAKPEDGIHSPLHPELHAQFSRVGYWRQILRDRNRPRGYSLRGLVKGNATSQPVSGAVSASGKEGVTRA